MVKRLEDLTGLDKEIIKSLKIRKEGGFSAREIRERLENESGESPGRNNVYDALAELIKYGSVRSYVKEIGGHEVRRYYLSRGLGSGARNKSTLYGTYNPVKDFGKWLSRIFGSIFILFGFGIIIYRGLSPTGSVISSRVQQLPNLVFISAFVLGLIGILLFSLKRER